VNTFIRVLFYILLFWLPYSPAVVETCVVLALILWILKRSILLRQKYLSGLLRNEGVLGYVTCFKPENSFLNKPILFFLIACFLSIFNSVIFFDSLHNFFTKTLEWFLVYFLVLEVFKTERQILIALGVILLTTFSTALDSLIQYFTFKDIFLGHLIEPQGRVTAAFKTPNGLGAYLILSLPLMMSAVWSFRRRRGVGVALSLCVVLVLASLVLTFSRGAWVGAAMGIIFMGLTIIWRKTKSVFFISSGILLTLILVGFFFFMTVQKRTYQSHLHRNTSQWRLDIWWDSLKMIKEKPLLGHGINTYMRVFQNYQRKFEGLHPYNPTYAHNCYLQLTAETGVIGLLGFLGILMTLFCKSFEKIKHILEKNANMMGLFLGMLSGIVAFLVHSFFDNNFYSLQLSVYLWVMIGMLGALGALLKDPGRGAV